jgi:ferric-dicitrate binding protein FerR (iron transport regulator)
MDLNPNSHDESLQKAERIAYLIAGHIQGSLTEVEQEELDAWIVESDENLELFERLIDEDNIEMGLQQHQQIERQKESALAGLKKEIGFKSKRRNIRKIWPYLVAAAVVLIVASILIFFGKRPTIEKEKPIAYKPQNRDIKAGTDKAVLTMSDGRTIILGSSGKGILAKEGSISIKKGVAGEIIYDGKGKEMKYNIVSTPRGGQYKLTLGDGTKVWLNAESSIKFPAGFAANQRDVELRGEAYFEVAKIPASPFKVKIITPTGEGGTVKVLGTHFNINSYGDEGLIKTTLLEGSVLVESNGNSKIIKPGEQAVCANNITIIKADVNEVVSWKDGKFLFRNETVQSIGEQIKRWYDLEVEYQGDISQHFNLEVSRQISLSELLDGLAGTGQIKFQLEGKKLIIKP